ncbi:MAG: HAD-IA family hydrolase [Trueperaceae bacterium]
MTFPLRALLFDLDGTLAHTDDLHFLAFRRALAQHGVDLDEAGYQERVWGRHNPVIAADLLPHLPAAERAAFSDAKEAAFRAATDGLAPMPGAPTFVRAARRAGLATALVTNAPRANAEHLLRAVGLSDAFNVVVIGDEAAAAKPDPAPYRDALQRLTVTAEEALAFEDSPSGIRSAAGAGVAVVGIASTQAEHDLLAAGASWAARDFADPVLREGELGRRLAVLSTR